MAGGSDSDSKKSTSKARRWVLRSPGRKAKTKAGDKAEKPAKRAPSPPQGPAGSRSWEEQQPPAQQQECSPLNGSSRGGSPKHDSLKTGAPRADECLAATDADEASVRRPDSPIGTLPSRSRSPLSRLRYNMSTPSCLLYTSPSPRDATLSRMPSSA